MRTALFILAVEVSRIGTALGRPLYDDRTMMILAWILVAFIFMDVAEFIKKMVSK